MRQRKLPSRVKVAGTSYTVIEKEVISANGNRNYDGVCSYYEEQIEILEEMSWNRKKSTFVHELLHAAMFEAGMKEHDEALICRLAPVLTQVLSDNEFNWMRE